MWALPGLQMFLLTAVLHTGLGAHTGMLMHCAHLAWAWVMFLGLILARLPGLCYPWLPMSSQSTLIWVTYS